MKADAGDVIDDNPRQSQPDSTLASVVNQAANLATVEARTIGETIEAARVTHRLTLGQAVALAEIIARLGDDERAELLALAARLRER